MSDDSDEGVPGDPDDECSDEEVLVIRIRPPAPLPTTAPPPDAQPMRVVTEGAVYEFDPRSMTAVRLRREGAHLRRDAEPLTLLCWPEPVIGHGMILQLIVREDGRLTTRLTTPVLRID